MFRKVMDWRIGVISTRGFINAFATAIVIACLSVVALGQPPDPAARPDRGTRPVGSYSISDIENISLQNGNVDISIPLAALPPIAGGKLAFTVTAHHNSKNWDMASYENEADLYHNNFWTAQVIDQSLTGGWSVGRKYAMFLHFAESDFVPVDPGCVGGLACLEKSYHYKMFLVTPDGSQHELRPRDYSPGATQNYRIGFYKDTPETTGVQMRYYSFDGSYLFARIDPYTGAPTNWEVYLPDGTRISNNGSIQKITDTNGNQIRILTETDTQTGVTTITYTDLGTVSNGNGPREIKVIAPSNQPPTQVTYQTVGVGSTATVETIDIAWGTTHVEQLYNVDDHTCSDVYGTNG